MAVLKGERCGESLNRGECGQSGSVKFSKTAQLIIAAKALDGQRYPMPLCEYMWVYDGERGSRSEGANNLCFVSTEALGLNLSINNGI